MTIDAAPRDAEHAVKDARSDCDLCLDLRAGDRTAFDELWRRHADAGLRVARSQAPGTNAEDLVAEAFSKIAGALSEGGDKGPVDGRFRPYLYVTIRSLAAQARQTPGPDGELADDPDQEAMDARLEAALDSSALVQSYTGLPARWREVLWYRDVEHLDRDDIARIMGMSVPAVSVLLSRARKALHAHWIQAHIGSDATDIECRVVLSHLGEYAAGVASKAVRGLVTDHLTWCIPCLIAREDAAVIAGQLSQVLLPVVLGVTAAARLAEAGGLSAQEPTEAGLAC